MNSKHRNEEVTMPVNRTYSHDLSFRHATTLDWFRLQPIMCHECIAGGTYTFDMSALVSSAPLATQVYGGAHLDLHAFFVPFRIIYEDWNSYIAGDSRSISSEYSLPFITGSGLSSLCGIIAGQEPNNSYNYKELRRVFGSLGYPTFAQNTNSTANFRYSLMHARAYQKIWWDYYRDSVNIPESSASSYLDKSGGTMGISPFVTRYRTFRKDYVSTLLASPQLGSVGTAKGNMLTDGSFTNEATLPIVGNYTGLLGLKSGSTTASSGIKLAPSLSASALRGAMAMQRYLERLNITGTRPMERLLALLGAKPSPERLDMAELIGSKTIKVNIDGLINSGSVEQVSASNTGNNYNAWGINNDYGEFGNHYGQGYQTGYGHARGQSDKITYHASEQGFIMVIASLIPEYINPNVLDRSFIRGLSTPNSDKFDFFTIDFDGLGYQEALLSEVATPSAYDISVSDGSTWPSDYNPYNVVGYEAKYEDYRRVPDRISGDFQEFESAAAMRQLAFTMSYPQIFDPADVQAGINLTTSSFAYRELFDKHFAIADSSLDHFICYFSIINDALLPLPGNQLPTELSDLANSTEIVISNGGVRL